MIYKIYILLFILLILLILYYLKKPVYTQENFTDNNIKIIQSKNKGFTLDHYTDTKKTFEIGGTWNIDKTDFYITIDKKNYYIKDNKNIYEFDIKNHKCKLNYGKEKGNLIIDNYTDEIEKIPADDGYEFKRNNKLLATIKLIKSSDKKNEYTLKIIENPEYKWIYIISFIIYNQKNKEINIDLDSLWKNT